MPTPITPTQLENASTDADTLDAVINGLENYNGTGVVVSRKGTAYGTLKKIIGDLSKLEIGEQAAALINQRIDALEARVDALESL